MICDKCGFEHNSRSVCPKCGERVVYVNEDYLKRRQEWEEAQKQGKKDALPPGIMHSTLEQRKAAKNNAGNHANKQADIEKGGPETASLSFRVKEVLNPKKIKEFFKTLAIKFIAFKDKIIAAYKRRFVKKRGADNPVIRELKFDDRPDTLDESNLVVSHKVYKDYRKIAIIGAGVLTAVIVAVIIIVNIVKNIDRSDVLFFDGKYAYLASDMDNALWGSLDGVKVIYCDNNICISHDDQAIYLYKNNSTYTIKTPNPEIITFNEGLDTIIYKSEGNTYIYNDGASKKVGVPDDAEFTNAVMISEKGNFYALTQCIKNDLIEQNQYKLYLGNVDGSIDVLSEGDREIEILSLSDKGELLYLEMSTAEFGIVNSRNINYYDHSDEGTVRCLAENVDMYKPSQDGVFYIDNSDRLYYSGISEKKFVDDEVTGFVTDVMAEDEVIYRKNEICYKVNNLEPEELCRIPEGNYTLVYGDDFYAYYDRTDFNINRQGAVTTFDLKKDNEVMISGDIIFVLNEKGDLYRISDKTEIIHENVAAFTLVEGKDAVAFLSNESVYVMENDNNKAVKIFDVTILDDVVFSGKKYYISDEMGILWEISSNGKEKKSLGNTEIYILVE